MYERRDERQELRLAFAGEPLDPAGLNSFVRRFVGSLCYVSHVPEDLDGQISIGVWDDELVVDSIANKPRMHMVGYPDVFRGFFEKTDKGINVVLPSRKEISEDIDGSLKKIMERSEGSLLETIGSRILKLPLVANQIKPITTILDNLMSNSSVSMTDFRRPGQISKYVEFLSDLDIVKRNGIMIEPGKFMERKMDAEMDDDDLYNVLLSHIVDRGMTRLFMDMHATHLRPFVRMTNANCIVSRIEDKPLRWDWSMFDRYLKKIYREKDHKRATITGNAQELTRAKILDKESGNTPDSLYFCEKGVFSDYNSRFNLNVTYS